MKPLPWHNPARAAALIDALEQRILVLDGAMGTMIQRFELTEADYRGERFARGYDSLLAPEARMPMGRAAAARATTSAATTTCSR